MSKITYKSRQLDLKQYESVLDCLLRHGQAIPYACKAGMCQACLVRAVDCEASPESKKWIKPALQAKGFTLACQWVPDADVKIELPGIDDFSVKVTISDISSLNPAVKKVMLSVEDASRMFAYRPGQYLTLINPDGIARSYSIANDYEVEQLVELHIGATSHGVFSNWIFNQAKPGTTLHMRGPAGECFYKPHEMDQASAPLILAGTGTGLAPLYGIVRDAIARGHTGPIQLFHGAGTPDRLYYEAALQDLAHAHSNLQYFPCVKEQARAKIHCSGELDTILARQVDLATLPQARVYLCGAPAFVHGMRKKLFLKGARPNHTYCDPFTERNVLTT